MACLCSQHNLGVARRRTRRGDCVEVDRSLPRDAALALRSATTPTAPVRGRLDTSRGPRGCSRRPGARRWRAGVGWRPTTTQYRRRPLSGPVLEVSPVLRENRPRLARTASTSKKKPPTSIILRNESRRWREGVYTQRNAEIRRASSLLRRPRTRSGPTTSITSTTTVLWQTCGMRPIRTSRSERSGRSTAAACTSAASNWTPHSKRPSTV